MSANIYPPKPILIVDDEEATLRSCNASLLTAGINNVILCKDERQVTRLLNENSVGLILLDLQLPYIDGDIILKEIIHDYPEIPVIVITASLNTSIAAKCLEIGCWDYLHKPLESERLITTVKRTIEFTELKSENISLSKTVLSPKLQNPGVFKDIVTQNKEMIGIFQYIEAIVKTNESILVTGETGVGKELIARAIHKASGVKGEYVNVDVSALSKSTFEDELCGHLRGAFTGADSDKIGFIKKAENGTLILNEIGELPSEHQLILLRLIQDKEYSPLGLEQYFKTTARIVAVTNVDLEQAVQNRTFRKDLFYRLNTHHIKVPPLRERKEEIPLLVDKFIGTSAKTLGKKAPAIEKGLIEYLKSYNYPGNVRELENIVIDAFSTFNGRMLGIKEFERSKSKFENYSPEFAISSNIALTVFIPHDELPSLKDISDIYIAEVLRKTNGNQTLAAEILGISRPTLGRRMKEMNLVKFDYEFSSG